MPPKASQVTSLSTEQVQLLCQVVQHSESPKKESWDAIAQKLNITNGNAAQQRFGRLLKTLKSADLTGGSDGQAPKTKTAGKRGAAGKQNGNTPKKTKATTKYAEEEEDEDDVDEENLDEDEETPSKKRKTEKENGTPKWKSVFGGDGDPVKTEDDEKIGNGAAAPSKVEGNVDGEVVN